MPTSHQAEPVISTITTTDHFIQMQSLSLNDLVISPVHPSQEVISRDDYQSLSQTIQRLFTEKIERHGDEILRKSEFFSDELDDPTKRLLEKTLIESEKKSKLRDSEQTIELLFRDKIKSEQVKKFFIDLERTLDVVLGEEKTVKALEHLSDDHFRAKNISVGVVVKGSVRKFLTTFFTTLSDEEVLNRFMPRNIQNSYIKILIGVIAMGLVIWVLADLLSTFKRNFLRGVKDHWKTILTSLVSVVLGILPVVSIGLFLFGQTQLLGAELLFQGLDNHGAINGTVADNIRNAFNQTGSDTADTTGFFTKIILLVVTVFGFLWTLFNLVTTGQKLFFKKANEFSTKEKFWAFLVALLPALQKILQAIFYGTRSLVKGSLQKGIDDKSLITGIFSSVMTLFSSTTETIEEIQKKNDQNQEMIKKDLEKIVREDESFRLRELHDVLSNLDKKAKALRTDNSLSVKEAELMKAAEGVISETIKVCNNEGRLF